MPPKSSAGTISGFSPLPVLYDQDTRHMLYIRAHVSAPSGNPRKKEWPEGRTMFMVNVPPDATEREIAQLFKTCGTVEKVTFDVDEPSKDAEAEDNTDDDSDSESDAAPSQSPARKQSESITSRPTTDQRNQRPKVTPLPVVPLRSLRRTGHTAHILFLDASSFTRALALAQPGSKPIPWPTNGDGECPRGLTHYITRYEAARPSLDAVRTHADSAIAQFDFDLAAGKAALRRESKYKKGEANVDEDGFTLVVRGGAYGQAVGGGVGVASRKFMDEYAKGTHGKESKGRRKRHKEGKEKAAFYAFQVHEKKRNGTCFSPFMFFSHSLT